MANVQLQSNIHFSEKVEISPKGFTLRGNVVIETKTFQSIISYFSMLDFMAITYPQGKQIDTNKFGKPICNPWGHCSMIYPDIDVQACITKLKPKNNPCSKLL
jgi:hypothetical protein